MKKVPSKLVKKAPTVGSGASTQSATPAKKSQVAPVPPPPPPETQEDEVPITEEHEEIPATQQEETEMVDQGEEVTTEFREEEQTQEVPFNYDDTDAEGIEETTEKEEVGEEGEETKEVGEEDNEDEELSDKGQTEEVDSGELEKEDREILEIDDDDDDSIPPSGVASFAGFPYPKDMSKVELIRTKDDNDQLSFVFNYNHMTFARIKEENLGKGKEMFSIGDLLVFTGKIKKSFTNAVPDAELYKYLSIARKANGTEIMCTMTADKKSVVKINPVVKNNIKKYIPLLASDCIYEDVENELPHTANITYKITLSNGDFRGKSVVISKYPQELVHEIKASASGRIRWTTPFQFNTQDPNPTKTSNGKGKRGDKKKGSPKPKKANAKGSYNEDEGKAVRKRGIAGSGYESTSSSQDSANESDLDKPLPGEKTNKNGNLDDLVEEEDDDAKIEDEEKDESEGEDEELEREEEEGSEHEEVDIETLPKRKIKVPPNAPKSLSDIQEEEGEEEDENYGEESVEESDEDSETYVPDVIDTPYRVPILNARDNKSAIRVNQLKKQVETNYLIEYKGPHKLAIENADRYMAKKKTEVPEPTKKSVTVNGKQHKQTSSAPILITKKTTPDTKTETRITTSRKRKEPATEEGYEGNAGVEPDISSAPPPKQQKLTSTPASKSIVAPPPTPPIKTTISNAPSKTGPSPPKKVPKSTPNQVKEKPTSPPPGIKVVVPPKPAQPAKVTEVIPEEGDEKDLEMHSKLLFNMMRETQGTKSRVFSISKDSVTFAVRNEGEGESVKYKTDATDMDVVWKRVGKVLDKASSGIIKPKNPYQQHPTLTTTQVDNLVSGYLYHYCSDILAVYQKCMRIGSMMEDVADPWEAMQDE